MMDTLKMHSLDGVQRNIELIGKLFPNAITTLTRRTTPAMILSMRTTLHNAPRITWKTAASMTKKATAW